MLEPIYRIEFFLDAIVNNTIPPEPVYRAEFYLAKIAGADVEIPEPVYRMEKYLAYLCGEEVELPDPIYRIEYYLAFLCGLNVELPEPIYRVEFWLWDWCGGGGIEKTITGNPIHITDALAKPVQALSVTLEPIQSGSGDPSPDNVRPISGHTDADVTRTGVNVWDEEWELGLLNSDGSVSSATRVVSKNYIPVVPNKTYCFSLTYGTYAVGRGAYYDADKNLVQYLSDFPPNLSVDGDRQYALFTVPENASYFKFCANSQYGSTYNHDISINYPSTDHDYHAYVGTTYPISLGTTVYGGTLDVVNGKMAPDREPLAFDNSAWGFSSNFFYKSFSTIQGKCVSDYYTTENGVKMYLNGNNGQARIYLTDNPFLTSESDVGALLNGYKLLYNVATPTEFDTTPTPITLLAGENNIWSDGTMTLVYLADGNASDVEALNILLGNRYVNNHTADDVSDREALQILLGGNK